MSTLSPVAPKIAKLIPRLGTDHDGEVVATVAAIRRTLAAAGLDLHDLAGALEQEPETRVVIVYREADPPSYPSSYNFRSPQWRRPRTEPEPLLDLAQWCRDSDFGRLNAREREFVGDLCNQLTLGRSATVKQAAWLRSIYLRLRRARP